MCGLNVSKLCKSIVSVVPSGIPFSFIVSFRNAESSLLGIEHSNGILTLS